MENETRTNFKDFKLNEEEHSLNSIAKETGVSTSNIWLVINEPRRVGAKVIVNVCGFLRVPAETIKAIYLNAKTEHNRENLIEKIDKELRG